MTGTVDLASERYSIGRARGEHRFVGRDELLGRDVLLWVIPVGGDEEREAEAALAAECTRLDHPVFLRTLDLLEQPGRVVVVLEAPTDAEQTAEHPLAGGLPALVAATLTLRIGTALDEAARRGLVAQALPLSYVHVSGADEVRLDPIGLFGDSGEGEDGLVPLLTEFMASFLPDGERASAVRSRFDPGADAATSLVERWRERAARGNAGDVSAFLDELRLIARAPADYYVEADAGFNRPADVVVAPSVPPDEEVTVPLNFDAPLRMPAPVAPPSEPRRSPRPAHETAVVPTRTRPQRSFISTLLTLAGFGLMGALGVVLVILGLQLADGEPSNGATVEIAPTAVAASPTPAPPDRATLSLTAQQDAQVRISVDGAVAFTGVLAANETRSWEGSNRVQVWTNNGKNLLVTVNGFQLGALSPAVGHPDWNTVDWGWLAGWKPQ
jgi:hypothetical protein